MGEFLRLWHSLAAVRLLILIGGFCLATGLATWTGFFAAGLAVSEAEMVALVGTAHQAIGAESPALAASGQAPVPAASQAASQAGPTPSSQTAPDLEASVGNEPVPDPHGHAPFQLGESEPELSMAVVLDDTFFDLPAMPNPIIAAWLPDRPACRRARRYYCDGPRWIPQPAGEAAQRAERLEIGSRRHYDRIMSGPGEARLLAEAGTPQDTLLWPVGEGTLGRGFGYVRHGALRSRLHRGVDIPAAVGAQVRGANEGLVIYAGNEVRGYGNLIVVLHGDDTRTLYAHLERSFVFAGEQVARGQIIGLVGRTGLTRAPHLHFEWRRRAVSRNPLSRFVGRPTVETQDRLMGEQRARREAGEVRLAEMRERRERRQQRRQQHRQQAAL